jgi:WD40 repeat protein
MLIHSLINSWVTQGHYWGPNTIVSASTDRSIALWDARVRRSPLFILRYHKSPVSDLLVGSRTDPMMVSAASDGTVATWDFRTLSGSDSEAVKSAPMPSSHPEGLTRKSNSVRTPASNMIPPGRKGPRQSGTVLLARGPGRQRRTVLSVGIDAIVREWDISTGRAIRHDATNHVDVISCFHSFSDNTLTSGVDPGDGASNFAGTITSSWDGTIRMRKLVKKK